VLVFTPAHRSQLLTATTPASPLVFSIDCRETREVAERNLTALGDGVNPIIHRLLWKAEQPIDFFC